MNQAINTSLTSTHACSLAVGLDTMLDKKNYCKFCTCHSVHIVHPIYIFLKNSNYMYKKYLFWCRIPYRSDLSPICRTDWTRGSQTSKSSKNSPCELTLYRARNRSFKSNLESIKKSKMPGFSIFGLPNGDQEIKSRKNTLRKSVYITQTSQDSHSCKVTFNQQRKTNDQHNT